MMSAVLRRFALLAVVAAARAADAPPAIAYLVVAHDAATLDAAAKLVDVLYDPDNLYLVHVDAKHRWPGGDALTTMGAFVRGRSNVRWAQLVDVRWGRWSMNEPTLWGIREALRLSTTWSFFINLSGDTWPVLTPAALRATLGEVGGLNFVTSGPSCPTGLRPTGRGEFGDGWHKKQAYPHPMLSDGGSELEAFYGSQWMILDRSFAAHVDGTIDETGTVANRLRRWFVNGTVVVEGVGRVKPHIADETFFPSVLMNSDLRDTGVPPPVALLNDVTGDASTAVAMRASFYVRMDEHYPWSSAKQRYASTLDRAERPWGPYYLGAYDLGDVRESRALFLRKASRDVDPNLFALLPVDDFRDIPDLRWPPRTVAVSPPPPKARETVTRGSDAGCVRVSESIHCPPVHTLNADVAAAHARAAALPRSGEL